MYMIYILFQSPFPLLAVTKYCVFYNTVLYSMSLLVIYFIYNSAHLIIQTWVRGEKLGFFEAKAVLKFG